MNKYIIRLLIVAVICLVVVYTEMFFQCLSIAHLTLWAVVFLSAFITSIKKREFGVCIYICVMVAGVYLVYKGLSFSYKDPYEKFFIKNDISQSEAKEDVKLDQEKIKIEFGKKKIEGNEKKLQEEQDRNRIQEFIKNGKVLDPGNYKISFPIFINKFIGKNYMRFDSGPIIIPENCYFKISYIGGYNDGFYSPIGGAAKVFSLPNDDNSCIVSSGNACVSNINSDSSRKSIIRIASDKNNEMHVKIEVSEPGDNKFLKKFEEVDFTTAEQDHRNNLIYILWALIFGLVVTFMSFASSISQRNKAKNIKKFQDLMSGTPTIREVYFAKKQAGISEEIGVKKYFLPRLICSELDCDKTMFLFDKDVKCAWCDEAITDERHLFGKCGSCKRTAKAIQCSHCGQPIYLDSTYIKEE